MLKEDEGHVLLWEFKVKLSQYSSRNGRCFNEPYTTLRVELEHLGGLIWILVTSVY